MGVKKNLKTNQLNMVKALIYKGLEPLKKRKQTHNMYRVSTSK